MQQFGSQDWRACRIREWLLLLLRFAITRDPKDQAAAFAIADEIDALGQQWRPWAPSFFRKTHLHAPCRPEMAREARLPAQSRTAYSPNQPSRWTWSGST